MYLVYLLKLTVNHTTTKLTCLTVPSTLMLSTQLTPTRASGTVIDSALQTEFSHLSTTPEIRLKFTLFTNTKL